MTTHVGDQYLPAQVYMVVALDVQCCSCRILPAISEGDQFRRILCQVGDALSVEELGREQLCGLRETSSEVPDRREPAHLLAAAVIVRTALWTGIGHVSLR